MVYIYKCKHKGSPNDPTRCSVHTGVSPLYYSTTATKSLRLSSWVGSWVGVPISDGLFPQGLSGGVRSMRQRAEGCRDNSTCDDAFFYRHELLFYDTQRAS